MSEAAASSGASSAGASSQAGAASGGSSGNPTSGNPGAPSSQNANPTSASPSSQGENLGEANPGAAPATIDDLEEISLGATKAKVPKSIAKTMKEYERAFQQKMREFNQMQKQAQEHQQLLELFDKNPDEFAKRKGINLDSFAEEILAKKYELMQATPEQRELMAAKQQLQEFQARELASKQGVISEIKKLLGDAAPKDLEKYDKAQLEQFHAQQNQVYSQVQSGIDKEFAEAWAQSGLPKHKYFGAMMAFQMMNAEKNGGAPLQASQVADKVKREFTNSVREVISQMDPKGIQDLLGKETLDKLRQFDVERVTSQGASQIGLNNGPGSQPVIQESKKQVNELGFRAWAGID
jgi:hypothetical protein